MMNREKVRVKGGVALSIEGTVFKNKDKKIPQIDIKRIQTMIKAQKTGEPFIKEFSDTLLSQDTYLM